MRPVYGIHRNRRYRVYVEWTESTYLRFCNSSEIILIFTNVLKTLQVKFTIIDAKKLPTLQSQCHNEENLNEATYGSISLAPSSKFFTQTNLDALYKEWQTEKAQRFW